MSKTVAHTPGPWKIGRDGRTVFSAKSPHDESHTETPIICKSGPDQYANEENLANAALIAAAPDLLAALEQLFEHCAMVHKHWGDGCNQKQADAAQKLGREAIARARGLAVKP